MPPVKLDKSNWRVFLDRLSKELVGKQAEIEVASLALGAQIETEWMPLQGIAYDPKDDVLELILDGLDHMIHKPREVWIDQGPLGVGSMEIIDAEGVRQIVKLRDPLLLPPSAGG
jgi:hypothetical protein